MEKKDAVDSAIEIILYATKKAREIIFKIKVLIGRLKAKNAESEVYYVNGPDVLHRLQRKRKRSVLKISP